MRFFPILLFFYSFLWAEGFSTYKIIKKDTPIAEIVETLKSSVDGIVLAFEAGTYDFEGAQIPLKNKNNVSIESTDESKVIFSNIGLYIVDSNFIQVRHIKLINKSFVEFYRSKHCSIDGVELEKSFINFKDYSSGIIKNILSKEDYKYSSIAVVNSEVDLFNINIVNNKGNCIYADRSFVKISKSRFSNVENDTIWAKNSKLYITDNKFINNKFPQSKRKSPLKFIYIRDESGLIAIKNIFQNNRRAIGISRKSTASILDNTFASFNNTISLLYSSQGLIKNNIINNTNLGISLGESSKATIQANTFDNIDMGILLLNKSKANILNNTIEKYIVKKQSTLDVVNKVNPFQYLFDYTGINDSALGIRVNDYCYANIEGTNILDDTYVASIWVSENARVFEEKNDRKVISEGSGIIAGSQIADTRLDINVQIPVDFQDKFDNIRPIQIDYKKLKPYEKQPPKVFIPKIIKGKLKGAPLIVSIDEDIEEVIEINDDIEIEERDGKYFIVKPTSCKGCQLDKKPEIGVLLDQIEVKAKVKTKNQKNYISFYVDAGIKPSAVKLNGSKLTLVKDNDGYKTKGRNIDIEATCEFRLDIDNKTKIYECKISNNNDVGCTEKTKQKL